MPASCTFTLIDGDYEDWGELRESVEALEEVRRAVRYQGGRPFDIEAGRPSDITGLQVFSLSPLGVLVAVSQAT